MKQTINLYDFERAFSLSGRENQFTYEGKKALFEYLEQYEEDCDTEIELDVIALCCEYAEYESLEEFHKDYDKEEYPDLDAISDHTQLIEIDTNSFIILQF